ARAAAGRGGRGLGPLDRRGPESRAAGRLSGVPAQAAAAGRAGRDGHQPDRPALTQLISRLPTAPRSETSAETSAESGSCWLAITGSGSSQPSVPVKPT